MPTACHRRHAVAVALAAVIAALVTGCAGPDETTRPTPQLSAEVIQSNLDLSRGTLRVQVTNEGEAPVRIDDLTLAAPPFPEKSSQDDAVIQPGRRINFRIPYGEPTCSGQTPPTTEPASAEFIADGRDANVTVDDSSDVLRRLLTLSCGRQRLAEVVEFSLDQTWTPVPGGQALLGGVELRRVGSGPTVTLEQVAGSVAYTLQPVDDADPIATLRPDEDALSVPLRAVALRCDPHARAEGKKNYVFPLWFRLDGGPEIHVEVKGDTGVQTAMDTLCGP
ncbi:MAG: hypothetical protein ACRDVN_09435 [Jiangellaceae bacterium]